MTMSSEELLSSENSQQGEDGPILVKKEMTVSSDPPYKRRRNHLTFEKKLRIISEVESGRSRSVICKENGLASSSLTDLIRRKDEIRFASTKVLNPRRKRMKVVKYGPLEEELYEWYVKMTKQRNIHITGPDIIGQAKKIAEKMKIEFSADQSWLCRFKDRKGIANRRPRLEYCTTSNTSSDNKPKVTNKLASQDIDTWSSSIIPEILKRYDHKNIFTAGETGLFFRCSPEKMPVYVNENCSDGRFACNRLTLFVATNLLGTEKLPLVAIGKHTMPRCFKNVKTIPTEYMANAKSWMIAPFFEQWVRKVDSIMLAQGRNIVLFVSPSNAHPQVPDLAMVSIVYLPHDTHFHPACQGILQTLKQNYKRSIIQRRLHLAEVNGPNDYEHSDISVLDALYWLRSAWKDVKPKCIYRSFENAEFSLPNYEDLVSTDQSSLSTLEPFQMECEAMSQGSNNKIVLDAEYAGLFETLSKKVVLDPFITADLFATLDDNVTTTGDLTEKELEDAMEKNKDGEDEEEEDEEEEEEPASPPPTFAEAKQCLSKLAKFFTTDKGTERFFDKVSKLYQNVRQIKATTTPQSDINDLGSGQTKRGRPKSNGPRPQNKRSNLSRLTVVDSDYSDYFYM